MTISVTVSIKGKMMELCITPESCAQQTGLLRAHFCLDPPSVSYDVMRRASEPGKHDCPEKACPLP